MDQSATVKNTQRFRCLGSGKFSGFGVPGILLDSSAVVLATDDVHLSQVMRISGAERAAHLPSGARKPRY